MHDKRYVIRLRKPSSFPESRHDWYYCDLNVDEGTTIWRHGSKISGLISGTLDEIEQRLAQIPPTAYDYSRHSIVELTDQLIENLVVAKLGG